MFQKIIKILLQTKADTNAIDKVDSKTKKHNIAVKALSATYGGLKKAGSATMKGLGHAWSGLNKTALAGTAALAGSVREFYTWNKEAARAWSMMDVGVVEFTKFRKEVARLAPELGVAKSELGKGWYSALSAGVDKNYLVDFLRTAAKVSVADGSSIESAIDGITTVLNAYNMSADQAQMVTDMMFKTVANGKTTFGALAAYISQAAPAAAAMGIGLEQILAALATVTKKGIQTSSALIGINQIMLKLSDQLGDGWAKSMKFQDALEMVAKKAGYSETALKDLFGSEHLKTVMAMISTNAINAANDLKAMGDSAGSLDEAFGKVDSQTGHWPRLWEVVRSYISDIGESVDTKLRPGINAFVEKLRGGLDSGVFVRLVDALSNKLQSWIINLLAGVQTAIDLLSKMSLGDMIGGSVSAVINMALSILAEGLRGLGRVMVVLAKVFAAAFSAEMMKVDIWGRDETKNARKAALKKIDQLSPEQRKELGVPEEFAKKDGLMTPEGLKERQNKMQAWANTLSLDQAAAIASSSRDTDMSAAIEDFMDGNKAAVGRMGGVGKNIAKNFADRAGVDVNEIFAGNQRDFKDSFSGREKLPDVGDVLAKKDAARAAQAAASSKPAPSTPDELIGGYISNFDGGNSAATDRVAEIEKAAERRAAIDAKAIDAAAKVMDTTTAVMDSFAARLKVYEQRLKEQQIRDKQF